MSIYRNIDDASNRILRDFAEKHFDGIVTRRMHVTVSRECKYPIDLKYRPIHTTIKISSETLVRCDDAYIVVIDCPELTRRHDNICKCGKTNRSLHVTLANHEGKDIKFDVPFQMLATLGMEQHSSIKDGALILYKMSKGRTSVIPRFDNQPPNLLRIEEQRDDKVIDNNKE